MATSLTAPQASEPQATGQQPSGQPIQPPPPLYHPNEELRQIWQPPPGLIGWLSTVNHRSVGTRYIATGLAFFALAGIAALLMRIQLAFPENNFLNAEQYNQLFTMHGTTMMFLFAVPIMEGVGIYLVPLMIGARDMAFPRLNAFGYFTYLFAGTLIWISLFFGVAPDGGWFAYTPLTEGRYSPTIGHDIYATLISLLEIAALVAAVELIVSIFVTRAPGMSLNRMPLFVWAILVTAIMIVFAMPSIIVASVALALDRTVNAAFFDPTAGGHPLLWQHLFWFFGHPEVYIIFVPALGIVASVLPAFARRPLVAYPFIVLSLVAIGILSFGLWVHHMFTTGLPELALSFFAIASMVIAIPSGIVIFASLATLWHGNLNLKTPLLYVLAFIFDFVLGGVTGIMVASVPFDLQVHDSYFVVAHFHYVLIGGAVFPLFAGIYYWFPKLTGKMLDEGLGKWNFWLTFIGFNVAFFPMHLTGLWGMPRRYYTYLAGLGWDELNLLSTVGAFILAIGLLIFVINVVKSLATGEDAPADPWQAGTLEWATTSPPPPYNFDPLPAVKGRYPLWDPEQSLNSYDFKTFTERRETLGTTVFDAIPEQRLRLPSPSIVPFLTAVAVTFTMASTMINLWLIPVGLLLVFILLTIWLWPSKKDRDLDYVKTGPEGALPVDAIIRPREGYPSYYHGVIWLIVIEAVVFAALISSYFYLRAAVDKWPPGDLAMPELLLPTIGTIVLIASSLPMHIADQGIRDGKLGRLKIGYIIAFVLALVFLGIKYLEYFGIPNTPFAGAPYTVSTHAYGSMVWTLIGYHSLHMLVLLLKTLVVGTWAFQGYFNEERNAAVQVNGLYWHFVVIIWLPIYVTLYLSPHLF